MDKRTDREETKKQWNQTPCGGVEGDFDNRKDYFDAVENERYDQQYWMHKFFEFNNFANKKVLEIGVGHGTDLRQFGEAGAMCFGADITKKHLQLAEENFKHRKLTLHLKECDASSLDFEKEYFDCVYSFGVIHHITNIDDVIEEIGRVLKVDGVFMGAVYHKYSAYHLLSKFFFEGIIKLRLFTLGYSGLLATIEEGADGKTIKPFVSLWSKKQMIQKFKSKGFTIDKIEIQQLHPNHFGPERLRIGKAIMGLFNNLESKMGWYVAFIVRKK